MPIPNLFPSSCADARRFDRVGHALSGPDVHNLFDVVRHVSYMLFLQLAGRLLRSLHFARPGQSAY